MLSFIKHIQETILNLNINNQNNKKQSNIIFNNSIPIDNNAKL